MVPKILRAFAISPSPLATINIVPAPINPENPASFPRSPVIVDTSVRAPPIPANPRFISSQDIAENTENEFAISERDLDTINMVPAPSKPENPASFPRRPVIVATSVRAPPIPANP